MSIFFAIVFDIGKCWTRKFLMYNSLLVLGTYLAEEVTDPARSNDMRLVCLATLWLLLGLGQTSEASPITITVDGRANGLFGDGGGRQARGLPLAPGVLLSAGATVLINARGTVDAGTGVPFGPNGATSPLGTGGSNLSTYNPVEEQFVDDGSLALPRPTGSVIQNNIGLFAAFLPQSTVEASGFTATDEDRGGSVASDALFVLGSTFTATFAGYLYFGVNDWYATNNSGAFYVDISPEAISVDEPGTIALVIMGFFGMVLGRCRCLTKGAVAAAS